MTEEKQQPLFDALFIDKATIQRVQDIIAAIDPEKIKNVINLLQVDEDGWLRIKIDLGLKK